MDNHEAMVSDTIIDENAYSIQIDIAGFCYGQIEDLAKDILEEESDFAKIESDLTVVANTIYSVVKNREDQINKQKDVQFKKKEKLIKKEEELKTAIANEKKYKEDYRKLNKIMEEHLKVCKQKKSTSRSWKKGCRSANSNRDYTGHPGTEKNRRRE